MAYRAQFERFIDENNRPQWIAFLRYWYQAHGSKPVDAAMLVEEFQKAGLSRSLPPGARQDAISLINKMVWHAAGWGFEAFAIAREGVGELGKQVYRVCCFARPIPGSESAPQQGDE